MEEPLPFTNARIVGSNYPLKAYLAQTAKRGDPAFVMHSTAIRAFLKNPMKWYLIGEDEALAQREAEEKGEEAVKAATKAQAWGSLVDCLLTSPDDFDKRYVMPPLKYVNSKGDKADWSWQSPKCREWRDDKRAAGFEVTTPDERERAMVAAERFKADPDILAILTGAQFQVHVVGDYTDPVTQLVVPCKVLIDVIPDAAGPYGRAIANIKTTNDGSYRKWRGIVEEHGLDIQGSLEFDLYNAAMPAEDRAFYYWPIQEAKPPYATGRREMTHDGYLNGGRKQAREGLADYCQCLKSGVWPGYDDPIPGKLCVHKWTPVEPSPWYLQRNL